MKYYQHVIIFLCAIVMVCCSKSDNIVDIEDVVIDRTDVDWGQYGETQIHKYNKFDLIIRNASNKKISGDLEICIELDLTKLSIKDFERHMGDIDKSELIENIEERIRTDTASPLLRSALNYLKGKWDKKGSKGYIDVELESDENDKYIIKTTQNLTLGSGETTIVSKNLVIPGPNKFRKAKVTITKYTPN